MVRNKCAELLLLARKRQESRWSGYKCIGDYHDGAYECDFVSPYSKIAGNVDSEIFVMLQDWNSDIRLSGPFDCDSVVQGHTPKLKTNLTLRHFLEATFGMTLEEVYGTNLFPFVKLGGMSRRIPQRDLIKAAREFALPQIRIIAPKLVICLGLAAFNALRSACGLPRASHLSSAIESPFDFENVRIWCQAHTGGLGQINRNRGRLGRVTEDWRRMSAEFRVISLASHTRGPSARDR